MKRLLIVVLVWLLAGCAVGGPAAAPTRTFQPLVTPTPMSTPTPGPWDGHGLQGRMVLIPYASGSSQLVELDLATGKTSPLFTTAAPGWIAGAAVSPDGSQAALAYVPPPADGSKQQYSFTDIYLLGLGAAGELRPLLTRQAPYESFFNPTWAPDGKSLYYAHFFNAAAAGKDAVYRYAIEKIGLDGSSPAQVLVQNALWPAVSPDGTKISYLSSGADGNDNALYVAASDGSQAVLAVKQAVPQPVDAHLFSADGQYIYFSTPNPQPSSVPQWWEQVLGIGVVQAHSLPSDWYRVPASGGAAPERISRVNDTYFNGHLSPDGKSLAFIGMNGLFVLDLASQQTTRLSPVPYLGSVDWIP